MLVFNRLIGAYFDLLMVRLSFFSSCFIRLMAAVYLAAVSLCSSSLRVFICSASITYTPKHGFFLVFSGTLQSIIPHLCITHSLCCVVEHLLPGRVKLPLIILQQPLFSQGDGLFGCLQYLRGPLEVLCGSLCFQLSL